MDSDLALDDLNCSAASGFNTSVPISLDTLLFGKDESTCERFCIASDTGGEDGSSDVESLGDGVVVSMDAHVASARANCLAATGECRVEKPSVKHWARRRRRTVTKHDAEVNLQRADFDAELVPHCFFVIFN